MVLEKKKVLKFNIVEIDDRVFWGFFFSLGELKFKFYLMYIFLIMCFIF